MDERRADEVETVSIHHLQLLAFRQRSGRENERVVSFHRTSIRNFDWRNRLMVVPDNLRKITASTGKPYIVRLLAGAFSKQPRGLERYPDEPASRSLAAFCSHCLTIVHASRPLVLSLFRLVTASLTHTCFCLCFFCVCLCVCLCHCIQSRLLGWEVRDW